MTWRTVALLIFFAVPRLMADNLPTKDESRTFSIDGKPVDSAEFDRFMKTLEKIPGSSSHKEITDGKVTGGENAHKAKNAQGEIYLYRCRWLRETHTSLSRIFPAPSAKPGPGDKTSNSSSPKEVPMSNEITLSPGETKTIDGLTVAHAGGGHKILADEAGHRAGDLSFGEIELKAEGSPPMKKRVYAQLPNRDEETKEIQFGPYLITVTEVGWNGNPIKLLIKKSPAN